MVNNSKLTNFRQIHEKIFQKYENKQDFRISDKTVLKYHLVWVVLVHDG
jgi:hypothetical protein